MQSKRQIKSFWWEPEHSEPRWFGTLTLENDETTQCRELISSVRTLLHFAVLKRSYPVWVTAYKSGYGKQYGERWLATDIEIISSNLQETVSEYPLPARWLFRFEDVQADFATFMRNWLDYTEKYAEPLGCYSSTVYHCLTDAISHQIGRA